jgi:hypothetical protein
MTATVPFPSDEMGRFAFDGAEGIAFWIYDDASQETGESKIMFSDLPVLLAFLRHNFPGLFEPTEEDVERADNERVAHLMAMVTPLGYASALYLLEAQTRLIREETAARAALSAVHSEVTQ